YNKYKNNDKALSLIPVIGFLCSFIAINTMEFFALKVAHYQNFNYFKQNGRFLYFNIICQLPVFLMGMSLYFRSKNMAKSNRWDKAALLLSFTAFTIIALFIFNYHSSRITLLSFLPAISFFFLFLIFKEFSFLSHKILARIGQLSFSIYLFHFLFAFEGSRILYSLLQNYMSTEIIFGINVVLTTAITAGVAVLSEKYIEKPGIEMGRRIIKKIKARGAAAQLQQLAPKESIS
ncbi:MAG: acyltransferase family protein, partial [Chitinophagaceae bacterium]